MLNAIYKDETLCYTSSKISTRGLDIDWGYFEDLISFLLIPNISATGYIRAVDSDAGGMIVKKEGASMAGWEQELAGLLRELGVTQEEPKTHLRPSNKLIRRDVKRRGQAADPIFLGGIGDSEVEDEEVWISDLNMMRREIDSIVRQVVHLMQRGDLDKSLKEDVMVVLRALRRRSTVTQQAATGDEAYLESAAAMLHFCRLVLRLSETAIEDM